MNRHLLIITTLILAVFAGRPASADANCSVRDIAGNWVFATNIGYQALGEPFPPGSDVTAIGTMNISRNGTISGSFDLTVEEFGFLPDFVYSGTVIVNPDCTGTLTFNTNAGTTRTDSIVIVNRRQMLGMSQDPQNLWTYKARRIGAGLQRGNRNDD
ncbi:MAG: hypothetical protein QNI99_00855 [Woeseiaceae bacterium]|nr:hypothetical protein [Woeseiaceae bacterium]